MGRAAIGKEMQWCAWFAAGLRQTGLDLRRSSRG